MARAKAETTNEMRIMRSIVLSNSFTPAGQE
jgi:hypothetical protein